MNIDRFMREFCEQAGMMGMMADPYAMAPAPGSSHQVFPPPMQPMMPMMPMGSMFPMNPLFGPMGPHSMFSPMSMSMFGGSNGGNISYCSSSVTSYTTDEHGRPQVYQQSNEVKQGPGGLRETKSALKDSRTGRHELSIGHHINEKGHVKKKARNLITGEEEQEEELHEIDESDVNQFEQHWQRQARESNLHNAPLSGHYLQYGQPSSSRNRLAITSPGGEGGSYPQTYNQSYQYPPTEPMPGSSEEKTKKKKKKSSKE